MEPIIDKLDEWAEAGAIRFLHAVHAFRLKKTPGLCPPQCHDGHTYHWPCRARIHRPKTSSVGAYRDKLSVDVIASNFVPEGDIQFLNGIIKRCIFCGTTESSRWWKCCPEHCTEQGDDVVCQKCKDEKHPQEDS
jgi:hypothetical protein